MGCVFSCTVLSDLFSLLLRRSFPTLPHPHTHLRSHSLSHKPSLYLPFPLSHSSNKMQSQLSPYPHCPPYKATAGQLYVHVPANALETGMTTDQRWPHLVS